ncbi:4a-hydroxytetrahydrobiopterin dehydratase [Ketobacter sp. MCCC 1A13808]|uniref:4a-hydroxytetrahydrobiopterin dehydratase n=1 Tax=Ketobacter sp. MCCC 1A13808 TaxID=2602738 RepID=UPI0012ECB051|nr:4a-hydroxytetrahydrobiopterin dehydratase [Ketobacter sp. MCCC 1A13808]MVF11684.1 4a-hydroxytetrahydrobiopterin dehydratase [Ketobacter sp. MCCC 1A13808]
MLLREQQCSVCHKGAPAVTPAEQPGLLKGIPLWTIVHEDGQPRLSRSFEFSDYKQAMAFTNRVAELAEQENHHPQMVIEWGKVTVSWWTHVIEGLHKNDFILAAKTDFLQ